MLSIVIASRGGLREMNADWPPTTVPSGRVQEEGTQGRSVDVTRRRLQTATSMERNLRERRLQVAMVVYRRTRNLNAA